MFLCDIIGSSTHLYMCVWLIHVPYTCTYIYMYMLYMYKLSLCLESVHKYMYSTCMY